MIVMKFGGTSVGGAQQIQHVSSVINQFTGRQPVVIVSAVAGITDQLVALCDAASDHDYQALDEQYNRIKQTHLNILELLCKDHDASSTHCQSIYALLLEFQQTVYSLKNGTCGMSNKLRDYMLTFGERLSARLVAQACDRRGIKTCAVDASDFIVTNNEFGNGRADLHATESKAKEILIPLVESEIVPIVTGFFGKSEQEEIVTLGRGGSDYSASITAYACNADQLIIWKEVDGVFTKDPQKHADAQFLPELTYEQAATLARAGAKVLHKETMEPTKDKLIPIVVKNTFYPNRTGTIIGPRQPDNIGYTFPTFV